MPSPRRRVHLGGRTLTIALVAAVSVLLVGCGSLIGSGGSIERDGSVVRISFAGPDDANARGWLCPEDPGAAGEFSSEAGMARLRAAGCLDLGLNAAAGGGDPQRWEGILELESLSSAQLEAFAGRETYRLVVAAGGEGFEHVSSTDVPAVDLNP